jgi:hypothetical protein
LTKLTRINIAILGESIFLGFPRFGDSTTKMQIPKGQMDGK